MTLHPDVVYALRLFPDREEERQAYMTQFAKENDLPRSANGVIAPDGRELIALWSPLHREWMWTPADGQPFDTKH